MKKNNSLHLFVFIFSVIAVGFSAVLAALLFDNSQSLILSIILACILFLMLSFSGRRNEPVYICLVSVLTALSVVGRIVFSPLIGFKPCTAIIIIAGIALGPEAGFTCGCFTALVSNIYMGQGTWTLYQMFSWGVIGLISGVLKNILVKNKACLYIFAALSGFLYSFLMDFFSTIWQDGYFNLSRYIALVLSSASMSVSYAVSNVVFLLFLFRKMVFAINRVVNKYGLDLHFLSTNTDVE
ncbi:MAG: ECF transporter S component [Ruminococcus sp.]|nr:ECF transporter S component [Ruminococcus sp.]